MVILDVLKRIATALERQADLLQADYDAREVERAKRDGERIQAQAAIERHERREESTQQWMRQVEANQRQMMEAQRAHIEQCEKRYARREDVFIGEALN